MFKSLAPINAALIGGWGAKTIMAQLAKKFPKLAPYVEKARKAGFAFPSILKFLTGSNSDINTHESEISERRDRTKRNIGLGVLGTAGGLGFGLTKLAGRGAAAVAQAAAQGAQATQVIPGAIPPGAGPGNPPGAPSGGNPAQAADAGIYTNTGTARTPPLHGPNPTAPQQAMQTRMSNVAETLSSETSREAPHLMNFISKQAESGKSPEEIESLVRQSPLLSNIAKQEEQATGIPLVDKIKKMAGKSKGFQKETEPMTLGQPEMPVKGSTAITPFGAGQVHKIHGNNAYVEVDGKLNKVPLSELETPDESAIKAVSDILKIPEIDRSSNVALFVYDPEENKALFQFHDGSMYKYLDIDPQVVQDIAAKNATPITSGQNEYGAWSPDDPHGSLGAALWAYLLKDPKYAKAKKGEPENPNYKKLQTLYDYWVGLRKKKKR